ncbi:hypothetical protein BH09CHL1_BH09CHL1_07840 [soil metagenome]
MQAVVFHLKAHLLRHLVVMSTVLGMLLVPATCANAAGPHSLFMSPMAKHSGSMDHSDHHASSDDSDSSMSGMSADEHAMHMSMGHTGAQTEMSDTESTTPPDATAAVQSDAPVEETGVRLTDLPSTMAMAAASNPSSIAELDELQFPPASLPATPRSTIALTGRTISLELPPPR